ncbi:MAG: FKBP-type peptidyl-prolyl cis-trans isomerase, partial [Deltaproteobacteria bacterium]
GTMKRMLCCLTCVGLLLGSANAEEKKEFKNPEEAVSYSIGFQMGAEFAKHGVVVDPEMIADGVRDALSGAEPRLSETDMKTRLSELEEWVKQAKQKGMAQQSAKTLAEGEAFLAENGKKKGVVTLPSGLQYQVLKKGEGQSPKAVDRVTVHYKGTFIDGKEFDSSYSRGKPVSFVLDRVIKGWTEGVQLMKPGAKWKLFIPAKLAYGEKGLGSRIPPNSALIFEVELIFVEPSKSAE